MTIVALLCHASSRWRLCCAGLLVLLLGACDLSSTPESTSEASVSGTLNYQGAAPLCSGGEVLGKLVFMLYEQPIGTLFQPAATPVAVRTEPADLLFDPADCAQPVAFSRSVSFTLVNFGPRRTLLSATDHYLTAVFDREDDLLVGDDFLAQPNPGDVFGAAYVTPDSRRFASLSFGPTASFPKQRLENVEITLDAQVWSEVPAFRVGSAVTPLSAEAVLPDDGVEAAWEDALHALSEFRLEVLPTDQEPWRTLLSREGIALKDDPQRGFWSRAVDPARLLNSLPHPIFGIGTPAFAPTGLDWVTPFVLLKRIRSNTEASTRVPDVYLVPLPRPTLLDKQVFAPGIDLLVPPVAIVDLDPELPICQIPYFAPGNFADVYRFAATGSSTRNPAECQELPTGYYEISVRHGVAGGQATSVSTQFSDIGLRVDDDEYIDQAWVVPNALGDVLSDQGPAGRFKVEDPDDMTAPDVMADDGAHGVALCEMVPDKQNPSMMVPVSIAPVPIACCDNVEHLCDIPLCDSVQGIRAPTRARGGKPDCMPFLLPAGCCP